MTASQDKTRADTSGGLSPDIPVESGYPEPDSHWWRTLPLPCRVPEVHALYERSTRLSNVQNNQLYMHHIWDDDGSCYHDDTQGSGAYHSSDLP
ncbi:uncharacterized [Tachysurus ichikawai]